MVKLSVLFVNEKSLKGCVECRKIYRQIYRVLFWIDMKVVFGETERVFIHNTKNTLSLSISALDWELIKKLLVGPTTVLHLLWTWVVYFVHFVCEPYKSVENKYIYIQMDYVIKVFSCCFHLAERKWVEIDQLKWKTEYGRIATPKIKRLIATPTSWWCVVWLTIWWAFHYFWL